MQRKIGKRLMKTSLGHVALVGRQPAQNKCAWCSKYMLDDRPCITTEQRKFILNFAKQNGKSWKKKLNEQWAKGEGPQESIAIRNALGPSWLADFQLSKLEAISESQLVRDRVSRRIGSALQRNTAQGSGIEGSPTGTS